MRINTKRRLNFTNYGILESNGVLGRAGRTHGQPVYTVNKSSLLQPHKTATPIKDDHAGNDGRVASRLHHERLSEQLTGRHDYADSE